MQPQGNPHEEAEGEGGYDAAGLERFENPGGPEGHFQHRSEELYLRDYDKVMQLIWVSTSTGHKFLDVARRSCNKGLGRLWVVIQLGLNGLFTLTGHTSVLLGYCSQKLVEAD